MRAKELSLVLDRGGMAFLRITLKNWTFTHMVRYQAGNSVYDECSLLGSREGKKLSQEQSKLGGLHLIRGKKQNPFFFLLPKSVV